MGLFQVIGSFFSGGSRHVEIIAIGLDFSGKTTILNQASRSWYWYFLEQGRGRDEKKIPGGKSPKGEINQQMVRFVL